jgi:hypothetical protein
MSHFFLIFRIFYSYFSFMIANVTIFGNVRTDHVHINYFFLIFVHILQCTYHGDQDMNVCHCFNVFILMSPLMTKQ